MTLCRKSLYRLQESTRLYRLGKDSLVKAELESYLAVLEPIEIKMSQLAARCFVSLCDKEGLTEWEKRLGMQIRPEAKEHLRRQAILHRLAVDGNSFTKEGLLGCLASAGIQADLQEQGEVLTINGQEFLEGYTSLEEITRMADQFVPAHLEFSLNIAEMTWEMFEQKNLTFSDWNKLDFTWEYFDIYGHLLRKEEEDAIQQ